MDNEESPQLPQWNDRKNNHRPSQNTKYRLMVWFKPDCMQKDKDGNNTDKWFWNGIYLQEKFELTYRKKFTGELHAIWFKLRQMYGRLDRVIIYCHLENQPDIVFEWQKATGTLVNSTKYNWEEVL